MLAAALGLTASGTLAAEPGESPSKWVARPSRAELEQALPGAAQRDGVRAALRCTAGADGSLSNCAVVSQTSPEAGRALASLASRYRLKPEAADKLPPDRSLVVVESWGDSDTHPQWRHRPTPNDLRVVWPTKAWNAGQDGRALINCMIAVQGTVYDCIVLEDEPAGEHFGQAAIALTPQFLFQPATRKGVPVVSVVSIPINFRNAGGSGLNMRVIPPAISWAEAPTPADMLAAFPPEARKKGLKGVVSLQCGFDRQGRVKGCQVVSAEPKRKGFEGAARTVAALFRLDPTMETGKLGDASVTLPLAFDAQALATPAAKPIWTRVPDVTELKAAFVAGKPVAPAGRAVLNCTVVQGGSLSGCAVASEEPSASGLGQTALALQPSFRVATWSNEGLPIVGEQIRVPVRFAEPAQSAPAAPQEPGKPTPAP